MNEYVIAGLVDEARAGRRVVAATRNMRSARCAFDEARHLATDAERVYRANGRERILFASGGEARFISVQSTAMRGLSADTVFLDHDALTDDEMGHYQEACLVVMANRGKVVRA